MKAPLCGHLECWEAAIDGETNGCLDCCEHGHEIDSGHPCMECAVDHAEGMIDAMKEGVL
jgi:hypothetical protein